MDLSYWASSGQPWADIVDGCRWAEESGWCGVWVPDHFMSDAGPEESHGADMSPVLEAWTLQAALAVAVPRVRIGAMVSGNTYRHPAVLANMAATVDQISGGRCVLGLGTGWQRNEHQHYGIELGSARERSDRLEEACQVIRGLLDNETTDFSGEYYSLDNAPCQPSPVQARLPLLVAGRGTKRTLRTVARWADEWNAWALPSEVADFRGVLQHWCDEAGRDVDEIRLTVAAFVTICDSDDEASRLRNAFEHRGGLVGTIDDVRAAVEAYAVAGVHELVIPDFNIPKDKREDVLGRLQSEVVATLG